MVVKSKNLLTMLIVSLLFATTILVLGYQMQSNQAHAYTLNQKHTFSIEMQKGYAFNSASQTKAVQQRLKYMGLYSDSIDGSYGPNTKAAVKKFQSKNNLEADGFAGPATTAKLRRSDCIMGKAATYGDYMFKSYPTYYYYIGTSSTGP